jgi:hypothetical protein
VVFTAFTTPLAALCIGLHGSHHISWRPLLLLLVLLLL